jgi:two-component sensor histidine kinase
MSFVNERLGAAGTSAPDSFPAGGGKMGELIRSFDWSRTELGPISSWPPALRTATNIVLQSPLPLVMLWGPNGIMIYNDAYSVLAGQRHPHLLGSRVLEGWAEVADFNARVLEVGLAGGTLSFKDQELTLYRNNVPEQVWMDLNYGPVLGDDNRPAGVLAIVVETTRRVAAERALAAQAEAIREANERLSAESAFLHELFEQAPSFMCMLTGRQHVYSLANAAYRTLIGHRDVIGKPAREALPEMEGQGFFELLDGVYRTGKPFIGRGMEVRLQRMPGASPEPRIIDLIFQPIRRASGEIAGIFVEGQDVTERAAAEARVRASEMRFRALVNATSDVIYRMSPDWREMRQLDGRGFLSDTERPSVAWIDEYLFPEDQPHILAAIQDAIRRKGVFQLEHRVRRADGSAGWTLSRAIPLVNDAGEITEWFGAASDVTARKQAEEHLRLVINELNHRVKNTLSTVQALAAQSVRNAENLGEAQEAFSSRIMALARGNDLLTQENWASASLGDIVRLAALPYCPGEPSRLEISGPDARLSPRMALSFLMAMHELVTNAVKYGAWSGERGKVRVNWSVAPAEGGNRLRLEWRECAGPPVTPPSRRGFGSRLIERGRATEMGGEARLAFRPDGLVCVIDVPLEPGEA